MRSNRRRFFQQIGAVAAAACVPFSAKRRVVEWAMNTTPTYAGIERSTFSFWRNQGHNHDLGALKVAMRDVYARCDKP